MAVLALILFGIYFGIAFVIRTVLQLRRTGDSGFRGLSGRPGSTRWWAGILFALALLAGLLGPVAALAGLDPIDPLEHTAIATVGGAAAVAGIIATVITQYAMGASWRVGVDATETTTLIITGPFGLVRNPVFTAMAITGIGLALLTPNLIALAGIVVLLIALQLQVRVVEEPYLLATHGATYRDYAAATGRFLPGIGRLTPVSPRTARSS
ncbi:methyltransferase family protein [Kribbella sp. CA-294648]|uniref:methyltransferase family protein n=1 Tax=Kribbella sp. CA-294648 TaxID=3239948 RepID=UPI003D8C263F